MRLLSARLDLVHSRQIREAYSSPSLQEEISMSWYVHAHTPLQPSSSTMTKKSWSRTKQARRKSTNIHNVLQQNPSNLGRHCSNASNSETRSRTILPAHRVTHITLAQPPDPSPVAQRLENRRTENISIEHTANQSRATPEETRVRQHSGVP